MTTIKRRARTRLVVMLALVCAATVAQGPNAQASSPYVNTVFRTWNSPELDVVVLLAPGEAIGASFQRAFNAWEAGIRYWSPSLASRLKLRYHWTTSGTVPPGVDPEIFVVPQGFFAASLRACIVAAPMAVGWGSYDRVTFHEFGHCLGLGHVWHNGREYQPGMDIMGSGDGRKCPSNLNVRTLENVFDETNESVSMSPGAYQQAPSC